VSELGGIREALRKPRESPETSTDESERGVGVGNKHTKAYRDAGGRGGLGDNSLEVHLLRVATACYESSQRTRQNFVYIINEVPHSPARIR